MSLAAPSLKFIRMSRIFRPPPPRTIVKLKFLLLGKLHNLHYNLRSIVELGVVAELKSG